MSDTPETDRSTRTVTTLSNRFGLCRSSYEGETIKCVDVDFARKLECERDEARRECGELNRQIATNQYDCLKACVVERDQLRKVVDEQNNTLVEIKTEHHKSMNEAKDIGYSDGMFLIPSTSVRKYLRISSNKK